MASQANVDKHHVTAVLVSHNGAVWLPEVVAALASQSRPIDFITAIDTGSQDSSTKLLKSARIPFSVMESDTGYGEAVTFAVSKLPAAVDNEWIWLIHDDCAPAPTALEQLLLAIEDRPQVVMVGPKLLGWHDRTHLLEVGISIAGNGARWTGLEPLEYDQGQHDGIHDVLSVSTAGALIRRDVFEELGGLDPNLALFRDDVDFGWRARAAGHSVIAATGAVAFHAQAAATERRDIDVEGAFLHRPLLLDRRNAAYVLLANSSWWIIPWLVIQLLGSAIVRAIGYLLAKLPGYASDEILAIAVLVLRPGKIIAARKIRKKQRFVSARVIAAYIPPRWSQLRLATERALEAVRRKIFTREKITVSYSVLDSGDDEDLLSPASTNQWANILRKPQVLGFLALSVIVVMSSRNRLGALVGGGLPTSPEGATDLWKSYFESWHQVGMGSSVASPSWVAILAISSLALLGKVQLLVTTFFLLAPLFMMLSAFTLLKKLTKNSWISVPSAFLYALSPVSIASIGSGRLATLVILILAPYLALLLHQWKTIETFSWRRIFGISLLMSCLYAFSLMSFVIAFILALAAAINDYLHFQQDTNQELFNSRISKRALLVFIPFLTNVPYSLEAIIHPSRLVTEPGILISGGTPLSVLLGNPGGASSLPLWLLSPVLLILLVSLFSRTNARLIAEYGIGLLALAVILASVSISSHGHEGATKVWTGPVLALVTLAAVASATVLLDRLRETLVLSHIHYRHFLSALLLASTIAYGISAVGWSVTKGADSLVQANRETVMPAFLSVEADTKILVLREIGSDDKKIQYYLSRGRDISLGEPDVAPDETPAIAEAARGLINGSGVRSSAVLSDYGVKYVFVKAPFKKEITRTIDGLGGFVRTSATSLGVVWRVATDTGRLMFINSTGQRSVLEAGEIGARTFISQPGTLVLTETYNRSWQILENGYRLEREKNEQGLPTFKVLEAGEISLIHDGTIRRGWLSLQFIFVIVVIVMALPAGRRKREISDEVLA